MATLQAGGAYTARARVTNQSTRGGSPVSATLSVQASGVIGSTPLSFSPTSSSVSFGPGETKELPFTFSVPPGTEGQSGSVSVAVIDPYGNFLATGYEPLTVQAPVTVVSFYFGLFYPPAGWDYWLPFWWDGTQWVQDPRGWISTTQMAWFQNVKPGPGSLGFYLWRSDTATTSSWYGPFQLPGPQGIVPANGDFWAYDFRTGTVYKS